MEGVHVRAIVKTVTNQLCRDGEWDENHANCVGDRAVERVEHLWVKKSVVRLV